MSSEPKDQYPTAKMVRSRINDMHRLMMVYEFGMEEILTKVNILRSEFRLAHDYNPIEHVSSRLKSMRSLVKKAQRKGICLEYEAIRNSMFDIAGIRLTCSFVSDIYRVRQMLLNQPDLYLLDERDYIANPKANGYKSLHLILEVPVFLTDRVEHVPVEVQIRTIAMDFWASLEHKIYYKYENEVPRHLTDALKLAADVAATLDTSMERIHKEVQQLDNHEHVADDQEIDGFIEGSHADLGRESEEFLTAVIESLTLSERKRLYD